ncbi:MAG: alpha/beta hydrolase [Firmicutes bacterium]|nr:alpha/beta hydrolase [Bacillota bacterium]
MQERRLPVWDTSVLLLEDGPPGGPCVALMHGLGSGARAWEEPMRCLAGAGLRCLAFDLPGFGETPPLPGRVLHRPEEAAAYVTAVLDAAGVARAHLVGWSLGGGVALHAALRAPERVAGLVLVASAALGADVSWGIRLMGVPLIGPRLLAAMPPLPPEGDFVRVPPALAHRPLPRAFVAAHLDMLRQPWFVPAQHALLRRLGVALFGQRRAQVTHELHRIQAPVLILWGREDRLIPPAHGRRAALLLPNARHVEYEDCGHCLPVEQPERFCRDVLAFVRETAAGGLGRA